MGQASPTVIVVTGGGGFSMEWVLVQPLVAKSARICVYDRAGYAWSDRGPVDDGIEQTVDDLHLLARKAQLKKPFVLVGQSLGALYARAYQRRFPDEVAGMVFVDGTPDEDVRMVVDGKRVALSRLSREELPKAHEEYLKSVPELKPGAADAPPFDKLPAELQVARQWAFAKIVREMGWLPNTLAAAESWRKEFTALLRRRLSEPHPLGELPLRVVERGKDSSETWHDQQVQLAALSLKGKLMRAEGSGHMVHLEQPEFVAQAIGEVVMECTGR